jgi:hypothetical protein
MPGIGTTEPFLGGRVHVEGLSFVTKFRSNGSLLFQRWRFSKTVQNFKTTKILTMTKTIKAESVIGLLAATTASGALTATMLGTSTQIDLTVSGTVEGTDLGEDENFNSLYLYVPGVEWAEGSLANFVNNESDGPTNTAPTIVDAEYVFGSSPRGCPSNR